MILYTLYIHCDDICTACFMYPLFMRKLNAVSEALKQIPLLGEIYTRLENFITFSIKSRERGKFGGKKLAE